ncbi:FAD dependent oxidoreductase [Xylariales sp. AK1849]|nr:FAD dependent oxidoreductase [Xylariales sp. AK1849]
MGRSVLVIGCGMAGISACLHISKECPQRQLSIISYPCSLALSDDLSKIVRIDYDGKERMQEAQTAREGWKRGSFFQHYHTHGRIVAYENDSETLKQIDCNREQLGLEKRQRGDKSLLEKFFGPSNAPKTLVFVHNPDDAVVDWGPCITEHERIAKEKCHRSGGSVYDIRMQSLEYDGEQITTVVLANGVHIDTRDLDVVLALGAWTKEVMVQAKVELPPENRIPVPTGLFAFQVKLTDAQIEYFKGKPVLSHIGRAEFLPPTQDGGNAKITWVEPFTMSAIRDVSSSYLAYEAMDKALVWARTVLPVLHGAQVTAIRFYCDGVTATQAPLIASHPVAHNLFVDCGGSYTRAKDLPTNGAYIAQILNGQEGPERFSWNGSRSPQKDQPYLVARDDFESLNKKATEALGNLISSHLDSGILATI